MIHIAKSKKTGIYMKYFKNHGKIINSISRHRVFLLYLGFYLIFVMALVIKQPFGDPPDEYNRFLIPRYIVEHGSLPNGFEESIRIDGYGFSYAFQPILPYMIQGYVCMFINLFFPGEAAMVFTARLVNVFFGLIMAVFIRLLSKEWFSQRHIQYLFCFLVMFLPQSLFVHSYVNTDSCCMMSIAILLYGLTRGIKDSFQVKSSLIMALGIIFCALSYYNAYGFILSSIFLFVVTFLKKDNTTLKYTFSYIPFLKKGALITLLVLSGISWWFIRSAILYDGDFLGLSARQYCASLYATDAYNPNSRITWQTLGFSMLQMLKQSNFLNLSGLSFIGIYGPMTIVTSIWVYRFYKYLFYFCSVAFCVPFRSKTTNAKKPLHPFLSPYMNYFFYGNMFLCMVIPFYLSIYYSYSTDYQPQGRYLLPALIPLALFTVKGFEKTIAFITHLKIIPVKTKTSVFVSTGIVAILIILIIFFLALTIWGYVYPYYGDTFLLTKQITISALI